MLHPNFRYWRAIGTLVGGTVGVGVFGLPFAFGQSGFSFGMLLLIVLGFAMTILNLMYGEVVLRTSGRHRLSGYVKEYLGPGFGKAILYALITTIWGAMLAYLIVGSTFLHGLLSPVLGGDVWMYGGALGILVLFCSRRGTAFASKLEGFVVIGMLFLFFLIICASLPQVDLSNLTSVSSNGWMAAYGVILFALSGGGLIPEMREIIGSRQDRLLPKAILIAMGAIVFLYAVFSVAVLGAVGGQISDSAVGSLSALFPGGFGSLVFLLGSLTIFSIFLMNAVLLQNSFHLDGGMSKRKAWLLSVVVPLALYLIGFRQFVEIIGFVGAVLGGVIGIFIVAMYESMRRSVVCRDHKCLQVPSWVSMALIGMFALGLLLELGSLLALWIS